MELDWWLVTSTQDATCRESRYGTGVQGSGHREHLECLKQMATLTTCGTQVTAGVVSPHTTYLLKTTPNLTA